MDLNSLVQNASVTLMALGWKLAGAFALWLVGRWLISFAIRLVGQALGKQQGDVTLTRYAQTALRIVLNIALIVALLGFFGVETTSFRGAPRGWRRGDRRGLGRSAGQLRGRRLFSCFCVPSRSATLLLPVA